MSAHIYLHIDRLVIDEALLGHGDREVLAEAVQAELARLLGQAHAGGWQSAAVPALRAVTIQVAPGGGASELGAQIADVVNFSLMQGFNDGLAPATLGGPAQ